MSYAKIYNSFFELSQEWVIKGNKFERKNLIETSVIVLCSYSSYSETKRDITREITKRRSFKERQRQIKCTFNADTDMMSGQFLRTDNILIVCTFMCLRLKMKTFEWKNCFRLRLCIFFLFIAKKGRKITKVETRIQ